MDDATNLSGKLQNIHWPSSIDKLQTGEYPIEIALVFQLPANLSGAHLLKIHNTYQESISIHSFSLKSEDRLTFDDPEQKNSLITTQIHFSTAAGDHPAPQNTRLTTWDSGQPTVPGLTSAVSNLANQLANSPDHSTSVSGGQDQSIISANPTAALTRLIRSDNFSPLFLAGAFLLSLALGSLHALTPGHGKTLVAAYLVGSHGRMHDAIFLGSVVTLTHTGSVLIFGFITLVASRYILPSLFLPWLEIVSGLLVILFGCNLLFRMGNSLLSWSRENRIQRIQMRRVSAIHSLQAQPRQHIVMAHSHSFQDGHPQGHSENFNEIALPHNHAHPGHTHPHGHSHSLPPNEPVTWRSLLALGISGGLVPCPDAIAILLVAIAVNRIPFGMLLIVAFSLGLALVLIAIGITLVQGFHLLQRNDLFNRLSLYAPIASSVVVLALGIGLTLSAVNTLSVSAGTQAPAYQPIAQQTQPKSIQPTFNFDQAKIIYTSPDQEKYNQLFFASVSGKNPIQLSHEAGGVSGYSVSPDGQTILYTAINDKGAFAIWKIQSDGTHRRPALECPTFQCGGPVWSPDEQKVIYTRQDFNQAVTVPQFTLWWLDIKSGDTRSVFRDQSFPGYAPAFSFDSQWLSYISLSKNAIEIFSLSGAQSYSIPNGLGFAEQWSPVEDSILFWDQNGLSQDVSPSMKKYTLATGRIDDLNGAPGRLNYPAAWSPDGQWIAYVQKNLSSDNSSNTDTIWLIRSDGIQAHILLNSEGISYTHIGWSPDSHKLVYSRYSSSDLWKEDIWMADITTG